MIMHVKQQWTFKVGKALLEEDSWLLSPIPRLWNTNALGQDSSWNSNPKSLYLTTCEGDSTINDLSLELLSLFLNIQTLEFD